MQDELKKTSQDQPPLYPEPHAGPLGDHTAQYARTRKYGSGPEADLQKRIMIGGLIVVILITLAIIALAVLTTREELGP